MKSEDKKLADFDVFYCSLGRSIALWQQVEVQLNYIFEFAIRLLLAEKSAQEIQKYYSNRDYERRLDCLTMTIKNLFKSSNPLAREWIHLEKKIKKTSRLRNKLVHFYTIVDASAKNTPKAKNPHKEVIYLIPFTYDAQSWQRANKERCSYKTIEDFGKEFDKIWQNLIQFELKLQSYKVI